MGSRYIITVVCPNCREVDDNVPYAPTLNFMSWRCPNCQHVVNLDEYADITYWANEDSSDVETRLKLMGIDLEVWAHIDYLEQEEGENE